MIEKIISKFNIAGKLIDVVENNSGNINNTYVATFQMDNGTVKKYLIQKINTTVFTEHQQFSTYHCLYYFILISLSPNWSFKKLYRISGSSI